MLYLCYLYVIYTVYLRYIYVIFTLLLLIILQDTHFDILILTQHWPYTTCTDWEEKKPSNGCKKIGSKTF